VTGGSFWPPEEAVVEAVVDWSRRRIAEGGDPAAGARPLDDLADDLAGAITPAGVGGEAALRLFTEVVVPATRTQRDPMNLAYVPAAPTGAATAFDLAVSAAGMFAGTWEAGAGAVAAENQALAWLASLAGWSTGWHDAAGGCFVSGATVGNLSALVAARERARSRSGGREGDGVSPRWRFAATGDAHSSVRAAARVMDVGVLDVPGDDRGRMTGEALAGALAGVGADPLTAGVFGVVVSAGTTNAGVVDDIAGVAEVCRSHGLWLHVDGAYGAAAMVAPSVAPLFVGMEHADSFVVDPHKWLFAPFDCCALVYREPEHGAAAHSQFADYLDGVDRSVWNPSDFAVHLTRRPRGLPFWFSLATHGTDRYRDAVETVLALTRDVADRIRLRGGLHLVMEPDLSVVLLERDGWEAADYGAWCDRQAATGTAICVPTTWRGRSMLRLCFVNPDTDVEAVDALLADLVRQVGPVG